VADTFSGGGWRFLQDALAPSQHTTPAPPPPSLREQEQSWGSMVCYSPAMGRQGSK